VAWEPLGWKPVFFSQFDPEHDYKRAPDFPSRVLAHHYPNVPNLGDMTTIEGHEYRNTIDVFCGGTPCQSFSLAGLRGGLADERGNLALTFCRLVDQIRPKWVVWENVPGVLSSNKGRDFGSILGALGELGYGFAYRVLDAQYFGVPQRRRRVFVVGHIGGSFAPPASVLFEPEGMCGSIAPRRSKRQNTAAYTKSGFGEYREGGGEWPATVAPTLDANFGTKQGLNNQHMNGGCSLFVPIVFNPSGGKTNRGLPSADSCHTLDASSVPAVYVGGVDQSINAFGETCGTLCKDSAQPLPAIQTGVQVRRLTPMECERLQGFPDGYTAIAGDKTPDSPRYRSLGNSMAVPVMQWLGERIQKVNNILEHGNYYNK
jgi:DNA (cytosine-5)-methyltransferase 1